MTPAFKIKLFPVLTGTFIRGWQNSKPAAPYVPYPEGSPMFYDTCHDPACPPPWGAHFSTSIFLLAHTPPPTPGYPDPWPSVPGVPSLGPHGSWRWFLGIPSHKAYYRFHDSGLAPINNHLEIHSIWSYNSYKSMHKPMNKKVSCSGLSN